MKTFNKFTIKNVERLRRKLVSVTSKRSGVEYNFTKTDVNDAIIHLKTLYTGSVKAMFAAKILLLSEIY